MNEAKLNTYIYAQHAKHARERKPLLKLRLCSPATSEVGGGGGKRTVREKRENKPPAGGKECVRVLELGLGLLGRVRVRVRVSG